MEMYKTLSRIDGSDTLQAATKATQKYICVRKKTLSQVKAVKIPTGLFVQCYKGTCTIGTFVETGNGLVHPAVPINTMVKTIDEGGFLSSTTSLEVFGEED